MSEQFEFEDIDNDEFNDAFDDEDAGSWTDDSNCFPDDNQEELPKDLIIENEYHSAYYSIKEDPINARKAFEQVIQLCDDYEETTAIDSVLEFRFKALTQTVKLLLKCDENTNNNNITMSYYNKLLASFNENHSPNDIQNCILSVLSICDNKSRDLYYDTTLASLRENGKNSLWYKIAMIRCNNLMNHQTNTNKSNNFAKCKEIIERIHEFVLNELSKMRRDGNVSTELLQVYCIKIELIMNAMDHGITSSDFDFGGSKSEMLNLIDLSKQLMDNGGSNGIIDVGSTAVINECLAKYVYCASDNWNLCHSHFQNSFVSYSSIAVKESRTISNLKYFLLSYCILQCQKSGNNKDSNDIPNPFSMNEVCVYEMNHAILNMKSLVDSLECNDITAFNRYYRNELSASRGSDPFLCECLKKLQMEFQGKVLINLSSSYSRMKLKWLSLELEMDIFDIEKLVVKLIIDGRIYGKLDQVKQILIMDKYASLDGGVNGSALVKNMALWMGKVNVIKNSICSKNGLNNRSYSAYDGFGDNDDFLSRSMMDDYDDEFLSSRPFVFAN